MGDWLKVISYYKHIHTNDNSYYYIQNKEREQILEEIKKEQV